MLAMRGLPGALTAEAAHCRRMRQQTFEPDRLTTLQAHPVTALDDTIQGLNDGCLLRSFTLDLCKREIGLAGADRIIRIDDGARRAE